VLRLRGDYLAIVTLGFGEIARILFLSDALKPVFGGTQGILSVARSLVLGRSISRSSAGSSTGRHSPITRCSSSA
jgi:ABC-type branched-subunit amino acid transport system permease subunit